MQLVTETTHEPALSVVDPDTVYPWAERLLADPQFKKQFAIVLAGVHPLITYRTIHTDGGDFIVCVLCLGECVLSIGSDRAAQHEEGRFVLTDRHGRVVSRAPFLLPLLLEVHNAFPCVEEVL